MRRITKRLIPPEFMGRNNIGKDIALFNSVIGMDESSRRTQKEGKDYEGKEHHYPVSKTAF